MWYLSLNALSKTPLYIQLAEQFEKAIVQGILRGGDILPSESQLEQHFLISAIVVKKAYDMLSQKGLTQSIKGKGTIVSWGKKVNVDYYVFTKRNKEEVFKDRSVLLNTIKPAQEPYVQWFPEIQFKKLCIQKSIFFHQHHPIYYQEIYIPIPDHQSEDFFNLQALAFPQLLEWLYPSTSLSSEHHYHIKFANNAMANLFAIPLGRPIHYARTYFYDQDRLIALVFHSLPSDRVNLVRSSPK
jgi:GntR family transcriptional regulator